MIQQAERHLEISFSRVWVSGDGGDGGGGIQTIARTEVVATTFVSDAKSNNVSSDIARLSENGGLLPYLCMYA